jgi:hypothetical protein
MKKYSTIIIIGGVCIALSALLHFVHYLIFQDSQHLFIYLLGDIAFLPLEVFFVVIVFERILAHHERQAMIKKLNMVIGAFFSEVGNRLLHDLLQSFNTSGHIRQMLAINGKWTPRDFNNAFNFASNIDEKPGCSANDLESLKRFLLEKRGFLLRLLENPNLLEHERFTDLLWATFHLTEEVEARQTFSGLPASDIKHLSYDIHRAYCYLAAEWVLYAQHLKATYPYLFSLTVRMNPFTEQASPVIRE